MIIDKKNVELDGLQAELYSTRKNVEKLKLEAIVAEREIAKLKVQEKIAIEEKMDIKRRLERKIETMSKAYVEQYLKLGKEYNLYKEYV